MTLVVVMHEPFETGLALPRLADTSPLSDGEAVGLYRAMVTDTIEAAARSGGEVLVNYPAPGRTSGTDPERAVRDLAGVVGAVDDDSRFEVQVGSTHAARAGNVVTHLLDAENHASVAVVTGETPLLSRTLIDSAAMKLRSREVVLGPASRGQVYFAGFRAPIDFTDAYTPPTVETLARRGVEAGHDVDFLPELTAVQTGTDLVSVLSVLNARRAAGRWVPARTMAYLDDLGVRIVAAGEEPVLARR